MKLAFAFTWLAALVACGTLPPLPPDCEGPLTPINGTPSSSPGANDEPGRNT